MPATRFERIALALFFVVGSVVFGDCGLIDRAQAQPGYVPPPTPLPPPVLNPSNPNTVQQPSYTPLTPSAPSTAPSAPSTIPSIPSTRREVTPPANEEPKSTSEENASGQSERQGPIAKKRWVHHHRGPSTLVTYSCGYLGCARTYPWAFPCQYYSRYCPLYGYAAPAYGDGHPRYGGYPRPAGYHGD